MEILQIIEMIQAVEGAKRRIPDEYRGKVTFFSDWDLWRYEGPSDAKTCIVCRGKLAGRGNLVIGSKIRLLWYYLTILDDNTIGGPGAGGDGLDHPNCRHRLHRASGGYLPRVPTELEDPELSMNVGKGVGISMAVTVRDTLNEMPEPMKQLIDEVEIRSSRLAPSRKSGTTVAGTWFAKGRKIVLYGDEAQDYTDEVVVHETGHAVYDDLARKNKKIDSKWSYFIDKKMQELRSEYGEGKKFTRLEDMNQAMREAQTELYGKRNAEKEKGAVGLWFNFQEAAKEESGVSQYARSFRNHVNYGTECFAEISYYMMHDEVMYKGWAEKHRPKQVKLWREIMRGYGWNEK